MTDASIRIERHHHITLCVGTAQEDYDFHTQVLGLKSVKKTALYDGDVPIYHLYYGTMSDSSRPSSPPFQCASQAALGDVRPTRQRF